jgi:two-component system sensor histidine kinase FlrB
LTKNVSTSIDDLPIAGNQQQLIELGTMLAEVAHQIRTPLSSAMLYTSHLMDANFDQTKRNEWVARIQYCQTMMEQQIQDLLLFARGDNLELIAVDLVTWGKRLSERVTILLQASGTILRINNQLTPVTYLLHEEHLIGAVLNLVSNAVQAGAKLVTLSLYYSDLEGLKIVVSDNGCGMSEEVKFQTLTPFFTTKTQGTGLGLAVVRRVVKSHKGVMVIDSFPNEGCCITLNLPV